MSKFCRTKFTKGALNGVLEWLPLSVSERLSRRQLTFTGSESCLTCLCSVVTYSLHQSWGPGPQYFAKGTHPLMIMLQHAIKS